MRDTTFPVWRFFTIMPSADAFPGKKKDAASAAATTQVTFLTGFSCEYNSQTSVDHAKGLTINPPPAPGPDGRTSVWGEMVPPLGRREDIQGRQNMALLPGRMPQISLTAHLRTDVQAPGLSRQMPELCMIATGHVPAKNCSADDVFASVAFSQASMLVQGRGLIRGAPKIPMANGLSPGPQKVPRFGIFSAFHRHVCG